MQFNQNTAEEETTSIVSQEELSIVVVAWAALEAGGLDGLLAVHAATLLPGALLLAQQAPVVGVATLLVPAEFAFLDILK